MELPDRREAKSWEGLPVVDMTGAPLGTCAAVFADTDTGVPEWLQLGETGEGRSFVPALDASESAGTVTVAFPASAVDGAPRVGGLAELSKDDERRLYAHYGIPVSTEQTDSLLPADAEPAAPSAPTVQPVVTATPPVPEPVVTPAPPITEPAERAPRATEPVTAPTPPPPAPSPLLTPMPAAEQDAPEQGSGLGAAAAPLGGAAALVLVGGLAARALRGRSRRRNRPAARAGRAAESLQTRAGAGRAQLLAAGAAASELAAQRKKAAAKETARRRKLAAKRKDATLKSTAKRKDEALKSTAKRRKAAGKRKDATTKAAATHVRAASTAAVGTLGATRKAASSTTSGLTAAPGKAGRKVSKARRGVARNLWQALVAGTAGTGYVLGAKAGKQRYAQIEQQASQLAAQPPVQKVVDVVTDAERREQLKQTAGQQGSALLSKVRSSSSS